VSELFLSTILVLAFLKVRGLLGLVQSHPAASLVTQRRRCADVLRMACDGWDGCTMLMKSGAHPRHRADPRKSLAYVLADILLTRGEGKIDEIPFASEIERDVPGRGMEALLNRETSTSYR
jgi:hypothetical protein